MPGDLNLHCAQDQCCGSASNGGIVTAIRPSFREHALNLAGDVAAKSPKAIVAAKRLLKAARTCLMTPLLQAEALEQARLLEGPDYDPARPRASG